MKFTNLFFTLILSLSLFSSSLKAEPVKATVEKIEIYRINSNAAPRVVKMDCPPLNKGYLVTVVDYNAFVISTENLPGEAAVKLFSQYRLSVVNGNLLYSIVYKIESIEPEERFFITVFRTTKIKEGCFLLHRIKDVFKLKNSHVHI